MFYYLFFNSMVYFLRGPGFAPPEPASELYIGGLSHRNRSCIMASSNAHHSTGFAAGLIAAVLVFQAGASGPHYQWSILAVFAGAAGGTAPDWLEVAWWSRKRKLWITHRTWTHWGVAWVALLVYSYLCLNKGAWAPIAFGFAAGGIMHLLADWPNPLGIPWILGRHSLNLWKSGRCDIVVVIAAWLAAFVIADRVCFDSVHTRSLIHLVRTHL